MGLGQKSSGYLHVIHTTGRKETMRICVFDLETRKGPEELDSDRERGWDKMRRGEGGISSLAIYDSDENWTYVYDDSEIEEIAAHLEKADVVIGYSSERFDLLVVEGLLKRKLVLQRHIDLYELIKTALAKAGIKQRKGENTLGAVSLRTLGRGKIEKGEHAPQLASEGRWGRLYRYCMDDVRLTKDLYNAILFFGYVVDPHGSKLKITLPEGSKICGPTLRG